MARVDGSQVPLGVLEARILVRSTLSCLMPNIFLRYSTFSASDMFSIFTDPWKWSLGVGWLMLPSDRFWSSPKPDSELRVLAEPFFLSVAGPVWLCWVQLGPGSEGEM